MQIRNQGTQHEQNGAIPDIEMSSTHQAGVAQAAPPASPPAGPIATDEDGRGRRKGVQAGLAGAAR
jgi:hypothetical protein